MDEMINRALIKQLRQKHLWSQEELAAVTGLSHRTIQRIENEGTCSLESKKALAAAFNVPASELTLDTEAIAQAEAYVGSRKFGYIGAAIGCISACVAISIALVNSGISLGEAGLYYGLVAAFFGASCAIIGVLVKKRSQQR